MVEAQALVDELVATINLQVPAIAELRGRSVALEGELSDGNAQIAELVATVSEQESALGELRTRSASLTDQLSVKEAELEELLESVDQGLSLNDIGPPSTIAGIEIYRSASQVPVQFGGTSVSTSPVL